MPRPPAIDALLASRLVDSQFPRWWHLPIEPAEFDGWDNRTFRLGREQPADERTRESV